MFATRCGRRPSCVPCIGAFWALRGRYIASVSARFGTTSLFCGVPLPTWTILEPSGLLLYRLSCRNPGLTYPSRSALRSHLSRTEQYGPCTMRPRKYDLPRTASSSSDLDTFNYIRTTALLSLCLSLRLTRLPKGTSYHSPRMPFGSSEQFGIRMSLNSWRSSKLRQLST